jgi:hypothetical protein
MILGAINAAYAEVTPVEMKRIRKRLWALYAVVVAIAIVIAVVLPLIEAATISVGSVVLKQVSQQLSLCRPPCSRYFMSHTLTHRSAKQTPVHSHMVSKAHRYRTGRGDAGPLCDGPRKRCCAHGHGVSGLALLYQHLRCEWTTLPGLLLAR